MSDTHPSYSLQELVTTSGISARTIRYYIAQGLLPAPVHSGPSTRYDQGHADRLHLIRMLQRQHLPLAEIRTRVERLRDDEVSELLTASARHPNPAASADALEYIRAVLSPGGIVPTSPTSDRASPPAPASAAGLPPLAKSASGLRLPSLRLPTDPSRVSEAPAPSAEHPPATPAQAPARSQWERIVLAPDIELHVRRPLSRIQNRAVDRLIGLARQLLEEDPS